MPEHVIFYYNAVSLCMVGIDDWFARVAIFIQLCTINESSIFFYDIIIVFIQYYMSMYMIDRILVIPPSNTTRGQRREGRE